MKRLSLPFSLALLSLSAFGCGSTMAPPRVSASGFTDASFSGGYALADSGETLGISGKFNETGVITFDGLGHLSGNSTMNNGGQICVVVVTGSYIINLDGSGSAMITETPNAASATAGCTTINVQAVLALSSGGAEVQFIEISSSQILRGVALKQ